MSASVTNEQLARIARHYEQQTYGDGPWIASIARELQQLRADKDGARYRWLRESSFTSGLRVDSFEFHRATWDAISGAALDAAIDAAMKAKP